MYLAKASPIICLILLSAFLPSIGRSVEIQEPQDIYLYRSNGPDRYDPPEKLMVAWNETKEMPEMSELASYGNYSVLIAFLAIAAEDDRWPSSGDYFVIASTLQPDNEGLIHQLIVRFKRDYTTVLTDPSMNGITLVWSIAYAETYNQKQNFNPITIEEAEVKVDNFLCGCFDPWARERHSYYPFIIFWRIWSGPFPPFCVSVIINELTGKIIAVSEVVTLYGMWGDWQGIMSHNPDINPTSNTLHLRFYTITYALPETYDMKPGAPQWCLYFDVNRDNIIDIYDAITFAKNR